MMEPYSNIMVSLDLTEMDHTLIRFVCQFAEINPNIQKVYFVHIEKDLEHYTFLDDAPGEEAEPVDEILVKKMEEEFRAVDQLNPQIEVHFETLEGDPLKLLLHWARVKFIDLMITGKKHHTRGKSLILEKLARKSQCSILFVPPEYSRSFKKVLVPVDFSCTTDYEFERISQLSKYMTGTMFICLHVMEVPSGYSKTGKTLEEFTVLLKEHALTKWKYFKRKYQFENIDMSFDITFRKHRNIAKTIFNYAKEQNVDLIIMGSKEQNWTSLLLIGSVAEKLITYDYDILLLLVKKKGEVFNFLRAIEN